MTTSTLVPPRFDPPSLRALPSGGALHVEGERGAAGMLFLHGVAGGAWSWRPQRVVFARTNRLFTWEGRGHGAAARVADAGLADYYVDAREALDAAVAQTGGPVVIVGHSMGGLLAMTLACESPSRVSGIFLIDPVFATEGQGHVPRSWAAVARFACAPMFRSIARDGAVSRAVARWMFARSFENRARMEASWPDQRGQIPLEYPRMLREAFDGPTGFPVRDVARELVTPAYVLESSRSGGHGRFPGMLDALRRRLGTRFHFETISGGHYLQLDRPHDVNARLRAFVDAHSRRKPEEA